VCILQHALLLTLCLLAQIVAAIVWTVHQETVITLRHSCKNFFYIFLFWSRFLRFLTIFIFQTFFLFLKKRWQSSERQAD